MFRVFLFMFMFRASIISTFPLVILKKPGSLDSWLRPSIELKDFQK